MSYEFHPAAEVEYLESIVYYESKQPGLGASFLCEFESKMEKVCSTPELYQDESIPNIKKAQMNRFPFSAIYRNKDNKIQILAVAHHRRRPSYWLDRL